MNLPLTEAREFVRSRIDELSQTPSDMFLDTIDDRNLDLTIEDSIVEAIVYTHKRCSPSLLEGYTINEKNFEEHDVVAELKEGVIDIDFRGGNIKVLRLVSFLEKVSSVIVTNAVDEDSPKGRMQLNKYVRGYVDDPVLVAQQDSSDNEPHYRYYSTPSKELGFKLTYFPYPALENGGYFISSKMKEAVLNYLTGMVLLNSSQAQLADHFFKKSDEYIK